MLVRLNKFIAEHSNISRRKADILTTNGGITVNDALIEKLGTKIDPKKDKIKINNQLFIPLEKKYYIALNKPTGYLSTRTDPQNRKTIMELIPAEYNLHPVGRLDQNTEGLIFLTNDGDFTYKITHPKFEKEKEYKVIIKNSLKNEDIKKIEQGIELPEFKSASAKISNLLETKNKTCLHITIHEGKKRQIRKIFSFLGYKIVYLKRLRIGNIKLNNLPKGHWRHLTPEEIKDFKKSAKS